MYVPRSRMPASIEKFIKASCLSVCNVCTWCLSQGRVETVGKLVLRSSLYKLPHVADPGNEIVEVSEIVLWGNLDNTLCQAPEVSTNMYIQVCTLYALSS
jgi:hypothetical protein